MRQLIGLLKYFYSSSTQNKLRNKQRKNEACFSCLIDLWWIKNLVLGILFFHTLNLGPEYGWLDQMFPKEDFNFRASKVRRNPNSFFSYMKFLNIPQMGYKSKQIYLLEILDALKMKYPFRIKLFYNWVMNQANIIAINAPRRLTLMFRNKAEIPSLRTN